MSRYKKFDRSAIRLRPIAERGHDLQVTNMLPLGPPASRFDHHEFPEFVNAVRHARANRRPVILMMGAHPVKLGLSPYLIDLLRGGFVTHLAGNGAVLIHDFELASCGGTSENVARWISAGQFGLWSETSALNAVICEGAERDEGLGEALGRAIHENSGAYPHRKFSLSAAAYRYGIPFTVHVRIGGDIIHSHASCSGAALGQTSYNDFLIFANSVQDLSGGVFLNIGTVVTGPELYLKALSMARNAAHARGERIALFTTAVFDLLTLPSGCVHTARRTRRMRGITSGLGSRSW